MIAVIEFDRPIPRRALGPYFGSGTIPLPDDIEYLANRLYTSGTRAALRKVDRHIYTIVVLLAFKSMYAHITYIVIL